MKLLWLFLWLWPSLAQSLVIDAGGPADLFFTGGASWNPLTPGYQPLGSGVWTNLRYGTAFSYDVPLANGLYSITFYLMDPNKIAAGQRKFTITANGVQSDSIDLYRILGAAKAPYETTLLAIVGNGHLKIQFSASIGNATVSAIDIKPLVTGGPEVVTGEIPAGVIDGTNAIFTLSSAPRPPSSLALYRNGIRLTAGVDFNLSGSTITFLAGAIPLAEVTKDMLIADYRK